MLRSNPQRQFALAQEAFAVGNYAAAVLHSEAVWRSLSADDLATRRGKKSSVEHSIIVVTYRHSDSFLELLESLRSYADQPGFEVVLVNNGNNHLNDLLERLRLDCTVVAPGFNYGASGARNLGAEYASGDNLIFVDDDGLLGESAIEALIECRERYRAVAVRGKIAPKTDSKRTGGHYDRGDRIVPCLPDTEGLCVWQKKVFQNYGGFDPLLYGHEGVQLACKMFRFYGPRYFLYTPDAVLFHDFYHDEAKLKDKTNRHDRNRNYLKYIGSRRDEIARTFTNSRSSRELNGAFISTKKWANDRSASETPLTIITTARNGAAFLGDYTTSLRSQTHKSFEVVFVDDGSSDRTADLIQEQWRDDPRLRVLRSVASGRGSALTTAVSAASHDICVIADVDDISVPHRLEWTARYFDELSSASCCAFYCFNEFDAIRMSRPFCIDRSSIRARALTGMPVSFPAFAFRKSQFSQPFDAGLEAGIDCEWLFRNLLATDSDGDVIPLPAVYYRVHDQQITMSKREIQRSQ